MADSVRTDTATGRGATAIERHSLRGSIDVFERLLWLHEIVPASALDTHTHKANSSSFQRSLRCSRGEVLEDETVAHVDLWRRPLERRRPLRLRIVAGRAGHETRAKTTLSEGLEPHTRHLRRPQLGVSI